MNFKSKVQIQLEIISVVSRSPMMFYTHKLLNGIKSRITLHWSESSEYFLNKEDVPSSEVTEAIHRGKNNESAGLYGIPVELLKAVILRMDLYIYM